MTQAETCEKYGILLVVEDDRVLKVMQGEEAICFGCARPWEPEEDILWLTDREEA